MTQKQKEALRLGTAIHKAIEMLPPGWDLDLAIGQGRDNTVVMLYCPSGSRVDLAEYDDETLAGQIENAVAYAREYTDPSLSSFD